MYSLHYKCQNIWGFSSLFPPKIKWKYKHYPVIFNKGIWIVVVVFFLYLLHNQLSVRSVSKCLFSLWENCLTSGALCITSIRYRVFILIVRKILNVRCRDNNTCVWPIFRKRFFPFKHTIMRCYINIFIPLLMKSLITP